jgi:glycosyltransferase involved in cell wall biosynthesis
VETAPRVAVVVPCFDSGATLPETLASVRGQECEVVVVDDGSKDELTLDVLRRAEQEGIRVIRQANGGPAKARWTGVQATSAPYVFPLDADDLLAPGALAALADALDGTPEAAFAYGYIGDPDGRAPLYRGMPDLDPWLVTYLNPHSNLSLIRRSSLEACGGWSGSGVHEDWDLWLTFAERGWHGVRIDRVAALYRRVEGGRWATGRRRYDTRILELRAAHAELFAARGRNWRRSVAPWRMKLLLPAIDRLPFSESNRRRLFDLAWRPTAVSSSVLRRFGRRLHAG